MEIKSAPPPWRYTGGGVIEDAAGKRPTVYLAGRLNDGNADMVGHLVAAAPDLYEALKAQDDAVEQHSLCECHRHPEDFICSMCKTCVGRYLRASQMRASAMAKARGDG